MLQKVPTKAFSPVSCGGSCEASWNSAGGARKRLLLRTKLVLITFITDCPSEAAIPLNPGIPCAFENEGSAGSLGTSGLWQLTSRANAPLCKVPLPDGGKEPFCPLGRFLGTLKTPSGKLCLGGSREQVLLRTLVALAGFRVP